MDAPNRDTPTNMIQAKLQAVLDGMHSPPPWYDAWAKLTEDSPDAQRLAVYQTIRRSGTLPDEASFFLVSTFIDDIAAKDVEGKLHDYEQRLMEIETQYGLSEGGVWARGAAPDGYHELRREYMQAWDAMFANKLEEHGEPEMARLFREDQARFEQLTEAGRQYFLGPGGDMESVPEVWVRRLVEAVAGCMEADSPMGPLGYRFGQDEDLWLIDIYPTPVELIGGAADGAVVAPGFCLDIESLRGLFERIDALAWQSLGFPGSEGSHVAVEGAYQGHEVIVEVLAYAPEDEEPGMKLDARWHGD